MQEFILFQNENISNTDKFIKEISRFLSVSEKSIKEFVLDDQLLVGKHYAENALRNMLNISFEEFVKSPDKYSSLAEEKFNVTMFYYKAFI